MITKNLLIYGGSFDPPHLGHLNTALNVQQYVHFQSFIFIPCKSPVLKNTTCATPADRIGMLTIMLKNHPEFSVSTREIDRESPSYMTETLTSYRNEYGPSSSITLLLGIDAFLNLHHWHEWEKIPMLCNLLVIQRKNSPEQETPDALKPLLLNHQCTNPLDLKNCSHGRIAYFDAGQYSVSSTKLRNQLQSNADISDDLVPEVYDYIKSHGLYQ